MDNGTNDIYVYEPMYGVGDLSGWFGIGRSVPSWFDRDIKELNAKKLVELLPDVFLDDDVFYYGAEPAPVPFPDHPTRGPRGELPAGIVTPTITVELLPDTFLDEDTIFVPMAVRALNPPDTFLKNEIIRIR